MDNANKANTDKKEEKTPIDKKVILKRIFKILTIVLVVVICYFIYSYMNKQISSITHYVVFDSAGGSNVDTLKVNYNDVATKPENPTKEGYKFKYWSLNNVEYNFNSKVKDNIILVAVWEKENKKEENKK